MNILKSLFVCFCALGLIACASKVYSPDDFKNYTAKQILASGEKALAKHNYKDSIKYFEAIDALYPSDPVAEVGQLKAIYAYYKADEYASALAAADRYIHLYPVGKHTDYVYYMKGKINFEKDRTWLQKAYPKYSEKFDLTNLQDAYIDFEELVKLFPKSNYAKDAKKRMLHIRDLLVNREIQTARFYFDRKAYVAAANRASDVVKRFEGDPHAAEALKIMVKSCRALGADKQADGALRTLKLKFPKEQSM